MEVGGVMSEAPVASPSQSVKDSKESQGPNNNIPEEPIVVAQLWKPDSKKRLKSKRDKTKTPQGKREKSLSLAKSAAPSWLPKEWKEDAPMQSHFRPLPDYRHLDEEMWDSKMKFWESLLLRSQEQELSQQRRLSCTLAQLKRRFRRKQQEPESLHGVLVALLDRQRVFFADTDQQTQQEQANNRNASSSGLLSTLLSLVWNSSSSSSETCWRDRPLPDTRAIYFPELVAQEGERLVKALEKSLHDAHSSFERILPMHSIQQHADGLSSTDLELVLAHLKREGQLSEIEVSNNDVRMFRLGQGERDKSELDAQIAQIKVAIMKTERQVEAYEAKIKKYLAEAKAAIKEGKRKSAEGKLKLKKAVEKTLEKKHNVIMNLETQLHAMEDAYQSKDFLQAMEQGAQALRSVTGNVEDAEDVMDNAIEAIANTQELSNALAEPVLVDNGVDQAVDEEYEEMMKFLADEELAGLPAVPSRAVQHKAAAVAVSPASERPVKRVKTQHATMPEASF